MVGGWKPLYPIAVAIASQQAEDGLRIKGGALLLLAARAGMQQKRLQLGGRQLDLGSCRRISEHTQRAYNGRWLDAACRVVCAWLLPKPFETSDMKPLKMLARAGRTHHALDAAFEDGLADLLLWNLARRTARQLARPDEHTRRHLVLGLPACARS